MNEEKEKNEIEEHFELFADDVLYNEGLRSETVRGYRQTLATLLKIVPEIEGLRHLTVQNITTFFKRVSTRERIVGKGIVKTGIKETTRRTYYYKLMAFFDWLLLRGYITYNPLYAIKRPKNPKPVDRRALSESEVGRILFHITTQGDRFMRYRDQAIVNILLYTGLRRGELIGLHVSDIDFHKKAVYVRKETSKSCKPRTIPMSKNLAVVLEDYINERKRCGYDSERLILSQRGAKYTIHGLKHWVNKYREATGINCHLHRFRHTFAQNLNNVGVTLPEIQYLMGHEKVSMTMQYIRSIPSGNYRSAIDKLSF